MKHRCLRLHLFPASDRPWKDFVREVSANAVKVDSVRLPPFPKPEGRRWETMIHTRGRITKGCVSRGLVVPPRLKYIAAHARTYARAHVPYFKRYLGGRTSQRLKNTDTAPFYTIPMVSIIVIFFIIKVNISLLKYSRFMCIFTIFTNKFVIFGQIIQMILAIFQ